MMDLFLQKWALSGARSKNVVVLDARKSLLKKTELMKIFSERYVELDPDLGIIVLQAAGFALTNKMPILLVEGETLVRALPTLGKISFNLKIVGWGEGNVANLVKEIPGWEVSTPSDESELMQAIQKIDSHFGPFYVHLVS